MGVPAGFPLLEQPDDDESQQHVEQAGGQERLERAVVAGVDDPRGAGQIDDGDDARHRRALQHEDHLVAVGRQCPAKRVGQNDAGEGLPAGHAEGVGRLNLPLWHVEHGPAHDFGGVGPGVQGERQQGAEPGFGKQIPGDAVFQPLPLGGAVVDDEELHQERGAAKEVDVGPDRPLDQPVAAVAQDTERHRQHQPEDQGGGHQQYRGIEALPVGGPFAEND